MNKYCYIFLVFTASVVSYAQCPDLDGAKIVELATPSGEQVAFEVTNPRTQNGNCVYNINPENLSLTKAAIGGRMTIQLALTSSPCPDLKGYRVTIDEPFPYKKPYTLSKTQNACEFTLSPALTDLSAARRMGSLLFTK